MRERSGFENSLDIKLEKYAKNVYPLLNKMEGNLSGLEEWGCERKYTELYQILSEKCEKEYSDYVTTTEKEFNHFLDKLVFRDLIGDGDASIFFHFMIKKFGYLLNGDTNNLLSKKEIELRRRFHKVIKILGPFMLSNKQVFENRNTLKNANDKTPDSGIELPQEAVIWTPNHGFKDDVLATVLAAKRHSYILFGSLPQFFNTFDGITAWLNGIVMINRKVKSSRKDSILKSISALNHNVDLIVYPEGVLNKTINSFILPPWKGIYQICKETGARVVPIIHYLPPNFKSIDKHSFNCHLSPKIHTVIDTPIRLDDLSEKSALNYWRDVMATWYYLLAERYGQITRKKCIEENECSCHVWEQYLDNITNILPYYDSEIELSADYRSKDIIRPEKVWEPVARLNISLTNAEYVINAAKILKTRKAEDMQRRF